MATLKSIKNKYLDTDDGTVLGVTTNTENVSLLSFKLATADSLSKFNLVDGFSDDYQDTSGVDAGGSTDEVRNATDKYYSGAADQTPTGGTKTTHGLYSVNTFLADGNLVVLDSGDLDFLVVAGGGSGGSTWYSPGPVTRCDGGGGAGGVRQISDQAVTAQTYAIVVGGGGAKATNSSTGDDGGDSSAAGISATGGGNGQNYDGKFASGGGSGGGRTGGGGTPGTTGNEGGYSPVEGYGGAGIINDQDGGGGGGGASEVGQPGNTSGDNAGGNGGDGIQNDWRTGSNVYYGGGGGGGSADGEVGGIGGDGGGGAGGTEASSGGIDGTANTGGGAGGAGEQTGGYGTANGGNGGSGIVVVRALISEWEQYENMTLASTAYTAQADPTTIRIIMDEYTAVGSATINTDIKAYASRDNGTTYTQITTLADQGTIETNHRLLSGSVDVSGQPAGSSVKYKIETLNQSVSKQTRVYGASMAWA